MSLAPQSPFVRSTRDEHAASRYTWTDGQCSPCDAPPGFDALSPEEKLDYIQALWERFTAQPESVPVPEWHREVVAERLATYGRGEGSSRSWDAVQQELRAKLRDVRG